MRICHVIESAAGGSAAVMSDLALQALKRGHQVTIIYSPDRADAALIDALGKAGCDIRTSQMQRSVGPRDFRDGLALRATLRGLGPIDVVHAHSSKAGALTRMFRPGVRAAQIYSPHGFYTMTGQAPAYVGVAERVLSYLGDRVVAVSKEEADHGVALGIPRRKLTVIPNGIAPYDPLPRSEARNRLGLPVDAFAVGFVGRFVDQKDPVSAVEVLNRINADKRVALAMIGDGELMSAVKKKAEGARHPVKLAGLLPARPLLSAFDCLLCTSRYEGMAISFLEALNCGVPIVTYDVAGSDELVVQPESGFVTDHDAGAAAVAIECIMAMSTRERKALSERSHTAGRYFSAERMGDATLELYEQVIAEKH